MKKVTVLGAGSWASAISNIIADRSEVTMYARRQDQADEINEKHTNSRYLGDAPLLPSIRATSSLEDAIQGADLIITGVPTQQTRKVLEEAKSYIPKDVPLMNISKGIERGSGKRISQIVEELLPGQEFAVLSGPSHAEEVIIDQPTTVVIASSNTALAEDLQDLFMDPTFRVYTGTDVVGVELGAAVKNILAIAIGIADGRGLGDNPKAALITRGVHEMVRFGIHLGGERQTLYGLAGLGDLIVTATSRHSRNRMAGELLGKGFSLEEVQSKVGQIIEGVTTCDAVYKIAKDNDISMPITEALYEILNQNRPIEDVLQALMQRERKQEFSDD